MKPLRVEVPFGLDEADLIVVCDVTLGRPQRGAGWVPGDGDSEVEIIEVVEDPSGKDRADLIDKLPLATIEDLAVEEAVREEAGHAMDAAENEAEAKRFGAWDY